MFCYLMTVTQEVNQCNNLKWTNEDKCLYNCFVMSSLALMSETKQLNNY